jgi:endonuclease YncB( thermonuclease family)
MRDLQHLCAHAPIAAALAALVLLAGCERDQAALDRLAATGSGKVARLISADAVRLTDGRTVRLAGVIAPREGEPHGEAARAALDRLLTGQEVELLSGGARQDAYGRTLAHLRRKQGRVWVQGALLDAGAVRVRTYADNRALAGEMLEREAKARRAGKGLWADKANQVLLPQEAARARGFAIVEGRAAAVTSGRLGDDIQLSDGGPGIEVQIPGRARDDFAAADKPAAAMKGKLIRVRGTLRADRTLRIDHPELLEVLAEPAGSAAKP